MIRPRRIGAALVAAGLACAGGGVAVWQAVPAHADAGETSLTSFELNAGGRGFNAYGADAFTSGGSVDKAPGVELGGSDASLAAGPVGTGIATFAWPGPIAANAGTLLLVLQPACAPTQQIGIPDGATPLCPIPNEVATQANMPFRAESHTGSKVPSASNDPIPGVHLQSSALNNDVSADAIVNQAGGGLGGFGKVVTHGQTTIGATEGKAVGSSTIQDFDYGSGAIKIKSIQSVATATTNGSTATSDASTVVDGMTIGGVPVTIDKDGIHVQGGALPTGQANDAVNTVLKNFGITITLGTPVKTTSGPEADASAPPVVIYANPPDSSKSLSQGEHQIILGGASASVTGAGGGSDLSNLTTDLGSTDTGGAASGDLGSTGGVISDSGSIDTGSLPTGTPAATRRPGGTGAQALGATQNVASHGTPIKTGAILLAVVGAGLLALGMRRLSDDVLAEKAATTCPLDEEA